jgi:hypothetical protein
VIDGQEERLVRGHNLSKAATTNEPFAWAITADGRSIFGADTDGCYTMSIRSADLIENCHAHNGLNPTGSIVAACFMMSRQKK